MIWSSCTGSANRSRGVVEQAKVLVRAAERTAEGMRGLRQADPEHLALYTNAIDVLEHEGDQLSRRVRAELYDFTVEHPAQHVLRWLDITDGVEDALDQLERVAYTVEGIILKHA
ncbi:MAG TPA: DUF47 family protein [Propionibacteriaceae bacterium]|nr:DUF47 family protein [Propionibacteriaceae bacterium]